MVSRFYKYGFKLCPLKESQPSSTKVERTYPSPEIIRGLVLSGTRNRGQDERMVPVLLDLRGNGSNCLRESTLGQNQESNERLTTSTVRRPLPLRFRMETLMYDMGVGVADYVRKVTTTRKRRFRSTQRSTCHCHYTFSSGWVTFKCFCWTEDERFVFS